MFDMRKCEELANIINTKHPEWKTFTVRGLKEISGYSHDSSRLALNIVNPKKEQANAKKTPKQSKKKAKTPRSPNNNNNNLEKGLDGFTTLNSESLEKLLLDGLRKQPNNTNLIGKAIDFFIKVKGNYGDTGENLDIEKFIKRCEDRKDTKDNMVI